jgi:hypothetical protein
MRELMSRMERSERAHRSFLRDTLAEFRVEIQRDVRALEAEVRDLIDKNRAQREALLRMIDRMDRMDPGGASA